MASIWPVAAINKIKSKRKDLIKENDIKSSIKSRKNANIHFFIYKEKFFLFWDQRITKDQSTLLHVSRRVTCKEQCVESLPVYIWPSQICSRGWRMCWLEAEGPFWVLTEKQRSGLYSWFLTAKTMVESLMAKAAPLPLSLLDNGDRLFGNPELLRESQHCSTLVHVFCERKFFLARQIWYTEPTSQTNFLLVLKKSLQC